MIWKGIKTIFGWLLMVLAVLRVISIAAHFVRPSLSGPQIWSDSSACFERGFMIACTTWWGTLIHLIIALCMFAWGWGIIHDMKKKSQPGVGG